jgi:folate-dependent tRNA-U54 methylase TrmFO/GidA
MKLRKRKEYENLLEELKLVLPMVEIEYRETKRIKSSGGLCVVKGKNVLIVKKDIEAEEKVEIIKNELKRFDLESKYIKPEVREFLEE